MYLIDKHIGEVPFSKYALDTGSREQAIEQNTIPTIQGAQENTANTQDHLAGSPWPKQERRRSQIEPKGDGLKAKRGDCDTWNQKEPKTRNENDRAISPNPPKQKGESHFEKLLTSEEQDQHSATLGIPFHIPIPLSVETMIPVTELEIKPIDPSCATNLASPKAKRCGLKLDDTKENKREIP